MGIFHNKNDVRSWYTNTMTENDTISCCSYLQLSVLMVMLGWLEVLLAMRVVWSSALMRAGELFAVVAHGTQQMLRLYAVNWDSQ